MKTKILKILFLILLTVILILVFIASQIYFYDEANKTQSADAAIVLGAAVWGERLSPVFQERVNHAINLYREKRVKKLIFTGGRGNADEDSESLAAKKYAIDNGVLPEDILIEESSHSTFENLLCAKQVAEQNNLKSFLLVSDPLHLKRSTNIGKYLEMEVYPSPTPTTRYKNFSSKMDLLGHETYYYTGFLLRKTFNYLPE